LSKIEQERDGVKTRLAESLGVIFQDKQAIKMLEKKVSMGNLALRNENIKNTEFSELLGSCADKTQLLLKDVGSTISAVQKLPDLLERMSFRGKIEGESQEKQSQTVILRTFDIAAVDTTGSCCCCCYYCCCCCRFYYPLLLLLLLLLLL
jgi:hypothetical protein